MPCTLCLSYCCSIKSVLDCQKQGKMCVLDIDMQVCKHRLHTKGKVCNMGGQLTKEFGYDSFPSFILPFSQAGVSTCLA